MQMVCYYVNIVMMLGVKCGSQRPKRFILKVLNRIFFLDVDIQVMSICRSMDLST